jgi:hypothetical protein
LYRDGSGVVGGGFRLFADALAFLAADVFTDIADTFAFVGLGRIEGADFGGELADDLFVDAFDLDFGVVRDRDGEAAGDGVEEWVGATEGEVKIGTLDGSAEADALDFKALDEPLGDAQDHILDEAAGSAVKGFVLAQFGGAGNGDKTAFADEGDPVWEGKVQFALGAFDDDGASIEFDCDFIGKWNWFEADS